jgi:hypothetical protein
MSDSRQVPALSLKKHTAWQLLPAFLEPLGCLASTFRLLRIRLVTSVARTDLIVVERLVLGRVHIQRRRLSFRKMFRVILSCLRALLQINIIHRFGVEVPLMVFLCKDSRLGSLSVRHW